MVGRTAEDRPASSRAEERADRGDDVVRLGVAHAGEHREGQAAAGISIGDGIACAIDF